MTVTNKSPEITVPAWSKSLPVCSNLPDQFNRFFGLFLLLDGRSAKFIFFTGNRSARSTNRLWRIPVFNRSDCFFQTVVTQPAGAHDDHASSKMDDSRIWKRKVKVFIYAKGF